MPAMAIARSARTAATVVRAEGRVMVVVCFLCVCNCGWRVSEKRKELIE
jgi:hypothetical protein